MASRMTSSKPNYFFPSHNPIRNSDGVFEFDDFDQPWMNNTNPSNGSDHHHVAAAAESKKLTMSTIPRKHTTSAADRKHSSGVMTSASVPVNIPDWSKILKDQRQQGNNNNQRDFTSDEEVDSEDERVPPHEFLARSRGASFSVHEGVGRTLKGRDLRRVRNAIWKQVGFED